MEVSPRDFPRLETNRTAHVVIVGAGMAGLSIAYELTQQGRSVIVLDRGTVARGMTARTTAHLSSACDDLFSELIAKRGEEAARAFYASQQSAIDRIAAIVAQEGIDCDFASLDGYLFAASERDEKMLDDELEACRAIGYGDVDKLAKAPFRGLSEFSCLRFPRQGRFHPLKYIDRLAGLVVERGGEIFGNAPVMRIEDNTGKARVFTEDGTSIEAESVVLATNSPILTAPPLHAKQAPYRTYALTLEIGRADIADVLYWDTEDPYHYVRRHPDPAGDVLIVGGEDHKSGEADDMEARLSRLEEWARARFRGVGAVRQRWSGQCMEPIDFCGFIGRRPGSERVYLVTGDSGQGITTGALAGIMIPEMIEKGTSRWVEAYDPDRVPPRAVPKAVSENVTAVKEFVAHLMPGEIGSADELRPGEGGLLREGLKKKLAVCRDEKGNLHKLSSACSHLGCTIHWNPFEQCWDCPCHGSQFAADGKPLNAPALKPMASAD